MTPKKMTTMLKWTGAMQRSDGSGRSFLVPVCLCIAWHLPAIALLNGIWSMSIAQVTATVC